MNTEQNEEQALADINCVGLIGVAALALAMIAGGIIHGIDRELDAAERAAAVPTHPNFGRVK